MDLNQYLDIFIDESKEHLQSLNEQLLILEKEYDNSETINEIFRAAHSLKGMAGTMGYKRMQRLTHDMENIFSEIRNEKMKVTSELVDVLFQGLDSLESYVNLIQETSDEGTEDNEDIINQLNTILEIGLGKSTKEEENTSSSNNLPKNGASSSTEYGYKELQIADFELTAIKNAVEMGLNIFGVTIYLDDNTLLKAARAFLIFRELGDMGEIIKSEPSVQDIEDENFDYDFSVILLTKVKKEEVEKAVKNIVEVKTVGVEEITTDDILKAEVKNSNQDNSSSLKDNIPKKNINKLKDSKQGKAKSKSKSLVNRSVRVDIDKLDLLMNLVSELIIAKNGLVASGKNPENQNKISNFNEQIEYLERVTTNLHESVMKVRMVPIESILNRFPRMIRDLSKKLNKTMELYITGEDTELDRTVIDEIGDPLMHLLRNAADHGLESNEERVKAGKPESGSIYLDASQEGNNVVIEVRDDGAGINIERVKEKGISKGILSEEQAATMSDKEVVNLLFEPSFSTSEEISDVSGRGVGLDVVKTKIQALGGDVEAKSISGKGTTFTIRLPLTLAIIQALMITIGSEKYAIPLSNIKSIEDIEKSELQYIQSKEVIYLREQVVPIIYLNQILELDDQDKSLETLTVIVIGKGDRSIGLVVDQVIDQQEIVVKSIGKYIHNDKIIGGATILGNGEVALILDVNSLF